MLQEVEDYVRAQAGVIKKAADALKDPKTDAAAEGIQAAAEERQVAGQRKSLRPTTGSTQLMKKFCWGRVSKRNHNSVAV